MKIKKVNREKDIELLLKIFDEREDYKENSENGLVLLLNGSWGSGKSTFLTDLVNRIKQEKDYEVFNNFNAYEYDFYERPYIPLFASIENKIKLKEQFSSFVKALTKNANNNLVVLSYSITKSIFKNKVGIDLDDIKNNMLALKEEEQNTDYLKDFDTLKKAKENIKKELNSICQKKTQVFIIDELDRCKPNFSMEILEVVKHFFDVKNCIFVIAVDKLQLLESAKTIYGQNMDSEKYFSKFFDYQYDLLPLKFFETIDTSNIKYLDEIVTRATTIFNILRVSTRDSKKIFNEFVKKYEKFSSDKTQVWSAEHSLVIILLLTFKYVDLLFYEEIINGNYMKHKKRINDVYSSNNNNYTKLLGINIGNIHNFDWILQRISSYIEKEYLDLDKVNKTVNFPDLEREFIDKQNIAKEMMDYIPQIIPNITFKQTIETIIN